ncbi:MAG: purine-nucleoside phosphorylase [Flavobacteriales bacterium]
MLNKINETVSFLNEKGFNNPEIGIVLGTGLGQLINEIEVEHSIDYSEIPHFPEATVEFHSGKLILGTLENKKVVVMQGRFHMYEGYSFEEITYPIRVFKKLGVSTLLLSNAAGAINLDYKKSDLMLIDDHINLQGGSPLLGKNIDELGPRFVDMAEPYSIKLNNILKDVANQQNIQLHEGVYVSVVGPQLETRAEYRYLGRIGADAVGMSTVPEVIVANHMNLPCAAVSVLTDECDPDNLQKVKIEEIIEAANQAEPKMIALFKGLIQKL